MMKKCLSLLVLCLLSCTLWASVGDTITVKLRNKSKRSMMKWLSLTVKESGKVYQPDSTGRILLGDLKKGKYTLIIRGQGFRKVEKRIKDRDFKLAEVINVDMYPNWIFKGNTRLHFTQVEIGPYWKGGGLDAISIVGSMDLDLSYKCDNFGWDNDLTMAYGLIRQGDNPFFKNRDQLAYDTKFSHRMGENLAYTLRFALRTQFYQGFEQKPDGSQGKLISNFFAPAYIDLGSGLDYKPYKFLSILYSPINGKITIVDDPALIANYLPQRFVENQQQLRTELGGSLNLKLEKEIIKNIILKTRSQFFDNYMEGNGIDVNLDTSVRFKINKYVSARVDFEMIYDDDVTFEIEENGITSEEPRLQYRESLSIGFGYKF